MRKGYALGTQAVKVDRTARTGLGRIKALWGRDLGIAAGDAFFVFVPEEERWKAASSIEPGPSTPTGLREDDRMATAHNDREVWVTHITHAHVIPVRFTVIRPQA